MAFMRIRERLGASQYGFTMLVAVVIGLLGGLGAIVFRQLISLVQFLAYGTHSFSLSLFESLSWWHVMIVPAIGGLIIGPVVYYFARETRGHGVPEVMEAVVVRQGVIRKRIVAAKTLVSAICIGTGGSVGREGPIVQIGSAIGSTIGQILKVSPSRLRTMVGCGAAAGIAATFNAPIAGVLFALEIILGDFGVRRFTPIVVSSVIATAISHQFLGDSPAFNIAVTYDMVSPFELLTYSLLGAVSGLVALAYIWMVYGSEDLFDKLKAPPLLKPALGGLLIGVVGLNFPEIFGVGYETIEMALNEEVAWILLIQLVGIKLLATSLTLGSGGSGGIFAPSLFIGAVLGGALGHLFHSYLPGLTASSGAYALVGMGALVAAVTHAPLTSIVIIFEMTNDYRIILPLMFACIIGTAISSRLNPNSIYTTKLARRGLNILRGREVNVFASLQTRSVLSTDFVSVSKNTDLGTMLELMMEHPHAYLYVVGRDGRYEGLVAVRHLRSAILDRDLLHNLVIAHDLMINDVPTVRGSDRLDRVMRLFATTEWEELPVVDDGNGERLVGVINRKSLIEAYNSEILKRDALNELLVGIGSTRESGPVALSEGVAIAEVEAPGWMEGKTLAELNLRRDHGVQVLMITRSGDGQKGGPESAKTVPQPDDIIRKGDNLVLLGSPGGIRSLGG